MSCKASNMLQKMLFKIIHCKKKKKKNTGLQLCSTINRKHKDLE